MNQITHIERAEDAGISETEPNAKAPINPVTITFLSRQDAKESGFLQKWEKLAQEVVEPNPFFEPWFLLPSLDQFDPKSSVKIACLYSAERLVGLLPISRTTDYYGYPIRHYSIWLHNNMFCGTPLVAPGFENALWEQLLPKLDRNPGFALFLHLAELPMSGSLTQSLHNQCELAGRKAFCVQSYERAMLASSQTSEDYFEASLSAKKRKELRRQYRRLGELGQLTFSRQTTDQNLDSWIAEFLALEQSGWKGSKGSAQADNAATKEMFSAALLGAAKLGKLERLTLRLDENPIAMLVNFITPPGAFSFKTAFDEDYARYSPGVLLQRENLALLENENVQWCDSCAAADHPMIERIWREKRPMMRANIALGGMARRTLFGFCQHFERHTQWTD